MYIGLYICVYIYVSTCIVDRIYRDFEEDSGAPKRSSIRLYIYIYT